MYATIRLFRLNPIFERDFTDLWTRLRDMLLEVEVVKSAVLHRESPITYISYVTWKNKETYEQFNKNKELVAQKEIIEVIENYCNSTQILHKMEIIDTQSTSVYDS